MTSNRIIAEYIYTPETNYNGQDSFTYHVFYGELYSLLRVNANGWIGFGNDNNLWGNTSIPNSNAPRPAILAFWDDLNPISGGDGCSGDGSGVVYYYSNQTDFEKKRVKTFIILKILFYIFFYDISNVSQNKKYFYLSFLFPPQKLKSRMELICWHHLK